VHVVISKQIFEQMDISHKIGYSKGIINFPFSNMIEEWIKEKNRKKEKMQLKL